MTNGVQRLLFVGGLNESAGTPPSNLVARRLTRIFHLVTVAVCALNVFLNYFDGDERRANVRTTKPSRR